MQFCNLWKIANNTHHLAWSCGPGELTNHTCSIKIFWSLKDYTFTGERKSHCMFRITAVPSLDILTSNVVVKQKYMYMYIYHLLLFYPIWHSFVCSLQLALINQNYFFALLGYGIWQSVFFNQHFVYVPQCDQVTNIWQL